MPLFEAACRQVAASTPRFWDLLDWLDDCLENDPRACDGVEVNRPESFGAADMWVWQSATITGLKVVRVLYEIQDTERRVLLWHVSAADLPDYGIM